MNRQGRCKGCGAVIDWIEQPSGKHAPFDLDGTSHFATCPKAADFRKPKPPKDETP